MCSVDQICPRPRTPSVGLPRFSANAAHADGGFPKGAAMTATQKRRYAIRYREKQLRFPGQAAQRAKAWRLNNKTHTDLYLEKRRRTKKQISRALFRAACKRGEIAKPSTCLDCGLGFPSSRLHGHHENYSKPFEVIWVCYVCHAKRHRKYA